MIKTAQDAYLAGRQAAMEKLAQPSADAASQMARFLINRTPGGMSLPGYQDDVAGQSIMPEMREADGSTTSPFMQGPSQAPEPGMLDKIKSMASTAGANQMDVLRNLGLTGRDLTTGQDPLYDPRAYATMENLARAGMLAGAGGGAYLGGMNPRAAAISTAGALGGGLVGGNLGQGVEAALSQLGYSDGNRGLATSIGGALGGLGGGLAAGTYLS